MEYRYTWAFWLNHWVDGGRMPRPTGVSLQDVLDNIKSQAETIKNAFDHYDDLQTRIGFINITSYPSSPEEIAQGLDDSDQWGNEASDVWYNKYTRLVSCEDVPELNFEL